MSYVTLSTQQPYAENVLFSLVIISAWQMRELGHVEGMCLAQGYMMKWLRTEITI